MCQINAYLDHKYTNSAKQAGLYDDTACFNNRYAFFITVECEM